ncbi:hypothetical protein HHK36_027114 [Tetracentron sinense]|uniref:holo-[acyl-carrier-protein] synthase n=1 Tax=Tetracentron sinense TaxID=13715 RepID=A0A835D587_TETSI|nr:hypothetical protein HHK36_027114 [Tetracentron sinense]
MSENALENKPVVLRLHALFSLQKEFFDADRLFHKEVFWFFIPFGPCTTSIPKSAIMLAETHFWYTVPDEVQSASLLNQYLELLSPCEKEHVFRMRGDQLQKRALLARALVRTTVARYTNSQVSPRLLKFVKNVFGKPEVEWQHDEEWDPPSLHFNISHTSSLIACGVTVDTPVIGIDVEEKQRKIKSNVLSFARRYFSSYEVELLHAISDPEIQRQEFIKLWTLKVVISYCPSSLKPFISTTPPLSRQLTSDKEAYVKALGRGFSAAPFKTFTIRFSSTTYGGQQVYGESNSKAFEIVVEAVDEPKKCTSNWKFALFELSSSHYAAICTEKDNSIEGKDSGPMKLTAWKTLPFVEDVCVSGTDVVAAISGLS